MAIMYPNGMTREEYLAHTSKNATSAAATFLQNQIANILAKKEEEQKRQEEIKNKTQQYNEYKDADLVSQREDAATESAKQLISSLIADAEKLKNEIEDLGGSVDDYNENTSNAFVNGSTIADVKGNVSYNGQSSTAQQSAPDQISGSLFTTLLANGEGNNIEIRDNSGHILNTFKSTGIDLSKGESVKAGDIVQYGGVSYVARVDQDGNIYGDRLIDYYGTGNKVDIHNTDGTISKESISVVNRIELADGTYKYVIYCTNNHGYYDSDNDNDNDEEYTPESEPTPEPEPKPEPVPPPKPKPIVYKNINLYGYQFGIDSIGVSYKTVSNKAAFVSDYIDLGTIHNLNTITLEANEYVPEHTSIEYYIIDGNKTIPVLNRNLNYIEEELLFPNLPTRFKIKNNSYIIKKNFIEINTSLEQIDFSNKDDIYTISYTPVIESYVPNNQKIKVKVIMRRYLNEISAPYINSIKIIKTGGGAMWEDISTT